MPRRLFRAVEWAFHNTADHKPKPDSHIYCRAACNALGSSGRRRFLEMEIEMTSKISAIFFAVALIGSAGIASTQIGPARRASGADTGAGCRVLSP
jgi:hypothetical protein